MIGKAIALSAMFSVLLLLAIGLPAQADRPLPCTVQGTSPGGHFVVVNVPDRARQEIVDAWIQAGFTDVFAVCPL